MATAAISLSILGLIFGVVLGIAGKKLHVENDPRVDQIIAVLPGANCGACGYPGCAGYAEAIVSEGASTTACSPGGPATVACIADIMGLSVAEGMEEMLAHVHCAGTTAVAKALFHYEGISSCTAAVRMFRGPKECQYGCFGLGTCAQVCPFDAITMNEDSHPVFDFMKCTGCGICVTECPQSIIKLSPARQMVIVSCSNPDKARDARKVCTVACIKCKRCEKVCPEEAIKVIPYEDGTLAVIDESLCTNCGLCVEACPTKCILFEDTGDPEERKVVVAAEATGCAGCSICG